MYWLALDLTTACVVFLILTLSGLWGYAVVARTSAELPHLTSALHDVSQKPNSGRSVQSGSKKAPKNRGKKKQGDGSSIPSKGGNKDVQKAASVNVLPSPALTVDASVAKTQSALPLSRDAAVKVPPQLGASDLTKRSSSSQKSGKEKKEKAKQSPEETATSNVNELPAVKSPSVIESEEGEWQTQLSRLQLRALKQKQRADNHKAVLQEPCKGGSDSEMPSAGTRSSDIGKVPEQLEIQCAEGVIAEPERHGSMSPELLACSLPDMETALVEAAHSTVSSAEEEKSSVLFDAAAKKTKKKKSKRKNKQVKSGKQVQSDKQVKLDNQVKQVDVDKQQNVDGSVKTVLPGQEAFSYSTQDDWVVINY